MSVDYDHGWEYDGIRFRNSDEYQKPSEQCHRMWQTAVEQGDDSSAKDYLEMYNLWISRNQ